MAGVNGENLVIPVPPGTLIYDNEHGNLMADLDQIGKEIVIARAGRAAAATGISAHLSIRPRAMPSPAPKVSSGRRNWN